MNIILFQPQEVELPLLLNDARARHILDVLRLQPNDAFDAGLIDGPRGTGTLTAINSSSLTLSFSWGNPTPPLCPIHLLVGLPRPQTSRDILRDMTTLGVASLNFIPSDRGERSYRDSSLWKSAEWKKHLLAGAAQAFSTRLPEVTFGTTLPEAIARLSPEIARVALDNYEASSSLAAFSPNGAASAAIAIGSERGWSPHERTILRNAGFAFVHLGPRVLRTETACVAAVTLIKATLGLL
ncbi:MAG: RsmE family RNA methyltransferase [Lacunisphaera sp.]